MPTTTSAVASAPAEAGASPHCCSHCARCRARAASPNTPLSTPMVVMPIWLADKKRVGSSPSLSAACAALSPSSIHFCRRALRAVTRAISAMANRPLSTIRANRVSTCMVTCPWCVGRCEVQRCSASMYPAGVQAQQDQQTQRNAVHDKHAKPARGNQAHEPNNDGVPHRKGHRGGGQCHAPLRAGHGLALEKKHVKDRHHDRRNGQQK